ncbi:MAG: hypothetical protein OEW18_09855 [Candidatus Aminicenantes bacterium]|nr:hypothetical protein [Candidatus Aminicenantes bacterium]
MTSESSLAKLLSAGRLKRQKAGLDYLNDLLEAACRNFEAARVLQGQVDEAAFKLYYDGLLQVSRAVVLLAGFRPDDGEQHKTTFLAAGEILGAEFEDLIRKIQKFRIKRNDCLYEPRGLIGKSEAQAIQQTAKAFWARVRTHLKDKNPQLRLFEEL